MYTEGIWFDDWWGTTYLGCTFFALGMSYELAVDFRAAADHCIGLQRGDLLHAEVQRRGFLGVPVGG